MKSEKEKQILYINAYMWNLEKWSGGTYFQGSNRDSDVENGHVGTVREGGDGTTWEISTDINTLPYTLPCIK